eukprot:291147_1
MAQSSKQEKNTIDVLSNWIREEKFESFPLELIPIIVKYLKNVLTWSRTKHGNDVKFIEDTKIYIDGSENEYVICCTDECISSNDYDIFSWELIFHKKCSNSLPGFIPINPQTMKMINIQKFDALNDFYQSPPFKIGGTCLNLHLTNVMWVCGCANGVKQEQSSIRLDKSLENGVKVGFRVNFINDTIEVFHNGINKGIIWTNIPKCFVIVTTACLDSDEVEIVYRYDNFDV